MQDLGRYRPFSDTVHLWPIKLPALLPFLRCQPDHVFTKYIFEGLSQGFRIGFNRRCTLRGNHWNHPSADHCPPAVTTQITSEVQRVCLIGPIPGNLVSLVHTSPIGLVPKPHSTNFRMIVDLSSPHFSINEGIQTAMCSLQYESVDQAVSLILCLGQGTRLVKLDLKDTYSIVPIRTHNHPLLDLRWEGST